MDILEGQLVSDRNIMLSGIRLYTYTVHEQLTKERLYLITCDDQCGSLRSNATLYQVLSHVFRFCQACDDA